MECNNPGKRRRLRDTNAWNPDSIPNEHLDTEELDRIIGVLYELTERWFQPVVKLAYGNRARPGPAVADDAK